MLKKLVFTVIIAIVILIGAVFASFQGTRKMPFSAKTLISPGISNPKNAAEGLKRFTDQMDILTGNGMNLFGFTTKMELRVAFRRFFIYND